LSLPYNKKLIASAKRLRGNMTRQEKHLWYDFLSSYSPRFQRQKTISNFIVDFYCHEAKLIIELDGSQHYSEDGLGYDAKRTAILESIGLHVLRLTNHDVDKRFAGTCALIDSIIIQRMAK